MKQETLQTLMIARILFDKAQEWCLIDDRFVASAGLLVLQDALELIMIACLMEKDVHQQKKLERLSFDQLIGELRKIGAEVVSSSTLKALNKQRVITKHYGHAADPVTVQTYLNAARDATDVLLQNVVGRNLQQIMLHEIIRDGETKTCIKKACQAIEKGDYFEALVEIRKAIFLEVEEDYSVEQWKDYDSTQEHPRSAVLRRGGLKAHWALTRKNWIEQNVETVFDYIQLDHDRLRQDLLEWGVSTQDFWNIVRLTPKVFRFFGQTKWHVKRTAERTKSAVNEADARYSLDRAVWLIVRKQHHSDLARYPSDDIRTQSEAPFYAVTVSRSQNLYKKASTESPVVGTLETGVTYTAMELVPGLDGEGQFVRVLHEQERSPQVLLGYIPREACKKLD